MSGMYKTEAEYDAIIAKTQEAIERTILLGEETENDSGGSSAKSREARLDLLQKFLCRLQKELAELNNEGGPVINGIGW